ncbi:hypothetical protein ACOME3_002621 [Neoechinorhynchus agilis]
MPSKVQVVLNNVSAHYTFEDIFDGLNFIPPSVTIIDELGVVSTTKDIQEDGIIRIIGMKDMMIYNKNFICSKMCRGLPNLVKAIVSKGFAKPVCLHEKPKKTNSSAPAKMQWMKISRICPDINGNCQPVGPARFRCNRIHNFGQIGIGIGAGVEIKVTNSHIMATPDNYDLQNLNAVIVRLRIEDSEIGVDKYRKCLGYPNLEALRLIKTKVSHRFLNECIIRPLLLVINNYPDEFSLNIAELIRGNAVQPNTTIVIDQDNNPNLLLSRPSPLAVNTLKNISLMLTLSKCPTCRDHEFHWLLALAQQSPFSTIRCKNDSILVNLPFVTYENCTPETTTNLLSSNATQNLSNQAYRFIVSEGCHEPIPIWVVFFMFFYDFVLLLICLALIARIRSIDETRKRLRRYRKENTGEVQSSTRPHESHFEELIENDKDDNPSIGLGTIPRRRILKSSSGNSFDDQDETELYHF